MENEIIVGQIFRSLWEAIKELKPTERVEIYDAIFQYQFTGENPKFKNKYIEILFKSHLPTIDRMIKNQKAKVENGKKGGAPKGNNNAKKTTENNLNQPKTTENKQKQPNSLINKKQEIINKKEYIEEKEIYKEKENNLPAETAQPDSFELQPPEPPKPNKPKPKAVPNTPQGRIYDYFANKYQTHTGIEYLNKKSDFVNLDKLIKQYGEDKVRQKIDWLEIGCTHPDVFWFAKDINDFTIGTLYAQWNKILPKLTEQQRKDLAKRQKEAETKAKVLAELAKDGIKLEDTENSMEVANGRI